MSYMVKRTSWWDYLPPEIQEKILKMADKQYHRERLDKVTMFKSGWKNYSCFLTTNVFFRYIRSLEIFGIFADAGHTTC